VQEGRGMRTIRIDDAVYQVPGTWNEITRSQSVALSRIASKTELTYVEMQLKFFLYCIGGSVKKNLGSGLFLVKTRKGRHALSAGELSSVLAVFDYLFEEHDGVKELSPRLTVNHFKKVRCGHVFLYGPNDALDNITYDEFVWLQTWQSRLNSEPEAVNELINVIYKTRAGKQRVANVRRMPEEARTVILWYYLGTLHFLERLFPHVFSGSGSGNMNVFDNQQRVIDVLAEGDVTKKMKVRQSLLYDALYSMEMAAIRIEELDKKGKK